MPSAKERTCCLTGQRAGGGGGPSEIETRAMTPLREKRKYLVMDGQSFPFLFQGKNERESPCTHSQDLLYYLDRSVPTVGSVLINKSGAARINNNNTRTGRGEEVEGGE